MYLHGMCPHPPLFFNQQETSTRAGLIDIRIAGYDTAKDDYNLTKAMRPKIDTWPDWSIVINNPT
jgi:hypothetical protein